MADKYFAGLNEETIAAAAEMGMSGAASLARVQSVLYFYHGSERIFASGEEPIAACRELLRGLIDFFRLTAECGFPDAKSLDMPGEKETNVEAVTGAHYGRLFETFSPQSYWDEPRQLLETRLRRNGIDLSSLPDLHVLDAGCGGGRYTVAWRLLGAGRATGVDISPINIATARERLVGTGIEKVDFQEGNVLALPFPDDHFDVVYSNGVLHHTVDWAAGIGEVMRVMKPGGWGWLYLIEEPGGLYWEMIELLREIMRDVDRGFARQAMRLCGIAENRIFYMLDHVMAPINIRLTPREIEECLARHGATEIKRLERGADFDRIERIYRGEPHAVAKFGVGENRFIFGK